MKKIIALCALCLTIIALYSGCGLVSGTVLVTEGFDEDVFVDVPGDELRGGHRSLDHDSLAGVVVDLTDNSDYGDIDVDGIDAGCVRTRAINHYDTPVSGEVWITLDTNLTTEDPDVIRAQGFRVFHGIALPGGQPGVEVEFTCEQTLGLIENLDQFTNAVQIGYFKAWGIGDQAIYCFSLTNIYVGLYLVGSL